MQLLGRWLIELSVAHNDLNNAKGSWRLRHARAAWWWVELSRWLAVGILGGSVTISLLAILVIYGVLHVWI